jgi:hypothetical protein
MLIYYKTENGQIRFAGDFCNFNGNLIVAGRKTKFNHKYLVYSRRTNSPVVINDREKMTIIDVIKESNYQIIFYIDPHNRLSFVKVKYHNVLNEQDIIDKLEKHPFFYVGLFNIFQMLFFVGVLRFRYYSFEDINLSLGYSKSLNVKVRFLFPKFIREKFSMNTNKIFLPIHFFWCKIPYKSLYSQYLENSEVNIPVFIKVINENYNYYYNLKNRTKDKYTKDKKHYIFNSFSHRIKKTDNEMFVRKSITGQFVIVITSSLRKIIPFIEMIAYICSLLSKNKEKYNIYFEKFSEGASESAFELFKYAVEKDVNAIYILDRSNERYQSLKALYPTQVFAKNSFGAFYRIFLANSFISSDLISHIQRRLYDNDTLIKRKILSNKNKIFLQHGVCLATNVFERGYYNTKVPIAPDYIIVNSKFEKKMFLKYTNYKNEQLIKTGLPNLDLYVKSRKQIKKDEITFLLTWRPWDLTGKIEKGSYLGRYFQFINLINKNDFYKDKKINIILHPKSRIILQEQFSDIYEENKKYFYDGDIKDALLKTKLLISDYSSVTYYGFAGGSNIIFYWEDKEQAEKEYGSPNILQKEIAFGDIVYKFEQLHETIVDNYSSEQKKQYKNRYKNLVECQSGNNTRSTYEYIENHIFKKSKNVSVIQAY